MQRTFTITAYTSIARFTYTVSTIHWYLLTKLTRVIARRTHPTLHASLATWRISCCITNSPIEAIGCSWAVGNMAANTGPAFITCTSMCYTVTVPVTTAVTVNTRASRYLTNFAAPTFQSVALTFVVYTSPTTHTK